MKMHILLGCAGLLFISCLPGVAAPDRNCQAELDALRKNVKTFQVIPLPTAPGEVALKPEQSLTINALRGVVLDPTPPVLGKPAKPYEQQGDGCVPGTAPYIAPGIAPFQFKYFTNELNYGGWHNFDLQDYCSAHGFNTIYPYVRDLKENAGHFPAGTKFLCWGSYDWTKIRQAHHMPTDRLEQFMDVDAVQAVVDEGAYWVKNTPPSSTLMVDMEYGALSPDDLRKQVWYPANGTTQEKTVFEKKYYDGYARSYTAVGEAARKQGGWKTIGIYGWQPMNKMWYGLENVKADPATYWPWNTYGRQINQAYDVIYPDVYCFYRVPQNVAFTLANIDLCMKIEKTAAQQKPLRPYYWTQLHGGDAAYHWWAGQPLLNEEMRAMTTMCFFTGVDGAVLWNWSEFDNHHIAPPLIVKRNDKEVGNDVMLKDGVSVKAEGAKDEAAAFNFTRYDMLHILDVNKETGMVRFQQIATPNPTNHYWAGDFKPDATTPVYAMSKDALLPHLRPISDPMSAMVEGLALVKPFEYTLRHGSVKLDQDSQEVFAKTLPIVRRVKLGNMHIVTTYDPAVIFGAPAREITLKDFDGHPGLVVKLPADEQTRIFVLQEK